MKYTKVRFGAAILAGSAMMLMTSSANAGWGHLRGGGSSGAYAAGYGSSGAVGASTGYTASYGSSGGYAASNGSSGYSAAYGSSGAYAGGSSGRVGLLSRAKSHLAAKVARHRARRASYGSSGAYGSSGGYTAYSGGSSGSYTSSYSGGSSGSYASSYSGGSTGSYRSSYSGGSSGSYSAPAVSYGSSGGTSYGSAGGAYYGASTNSAASASSIVSNVSGDAVYLTVAVPSEAKIFVNGTETTSTGVVREFVSRGLKPDKTYKFEVRAEMVAADGSKMVEDKTLVVSAGNRENVKFAFADYDSPIETALTLNVPEGAEVTLAGNKTKAQGEQRVYRTAQLKTGDVWEDYQIEVRVGDQVKQRSIRLIAGDQLQLTFAFDESAEKLASR